MTATFSPRRALHQQATPAELTGEAPLAVFGAGPGNAWGGREDWSEDYSSRRLWDGCLDAPQLLPAGSTRGVYIDPAIGGMGFEGAAATTHSRG
jgi:hypothetical protein